MIQLRDKIIAKYKTRFPYMADSIRPFISRLDRNSDPLVSFLAPGLLVAVLPTVEAPPEMKAWELEAKFSVGIGVSGASAEERDRDGWNLALQVAEVAYRNCWGFDSGLEITPATIDSISRNVLVDPTDGTPTGVFYWTVDFTNLVTFETLLKGVR